MARIRPFAAFRYDLNRVSAETVLTQPYDKITPAMRRQYLAASPYNLVRIILGEGQPDDDEANNVYTRATGFLQEWTHAGIVRRDPEPALYPYEQRFAHPADPSRHFTRRGFIALGGLEPYERRVVFRHEQTLSGPKVDRLKLLRATRTHFGQIFMLYSDSSQMLEAELWQRAQNPILECRDEFGTEHRLFRETDAALIDRLRQAMAPHPLIIADGHHRYETALAWQAEEAARRAGGGGADVPVGGAPWDWAMMTFINMDAPGLLVLPTHRVLHSLPEWQPQRLLQRLEGWFEAVPSCARGWETLQAQLAAEKEAGRIVIGALLRGEPQAFVLRLKPGIDLARELPAALPQQRSLDVLLLHELILSRGLEISAEAVRSEKYLHYERSAQNAFNAVGTGEAQAAFLLNAIAPEEMREIALAGGVLPQKSTDFYPKLLSGLTLYKVE